MGDFWGVENVDLDIKSFNGVSALLINSDKGKEFINRVSDLMIINEVSIVQCLRDNSAKLVSALGLSRSSKYIQDVNGDNIEELTARYADAGSLLRKCIRKVTNLLYKLRRKYLEIKLHNLGKSV